MVKSPLLLVAVLALVGAAAQQSSGASPIRNGRIAYDHLGESGSHGQIYTSTPTGNHRRHLTHSRRYSSLAPSYSPNGKRIVFVRAYKQSDLWTMNANGTNARDLTRTKAVRETDPAWSPDGKEIAFRVERPAAQQGIWIVGVDGHGRHRLTNDLDSHPTWSPDGTEIAFTRASGDVNDPWSQIFVVPAVGGTATNLSNDLSVEDLQPAWSPDGSRILFSSVPADGYELDLWVMNADGSNRRQVTNTTFFDEHNPAWSPDGKRIVYVGESSSHGAASYQLYVSDANGSKRRIITHACGECGIIDDDPSWQPLR